MSEDRNGQQPGETDDLDELLDDNEDDGGDRPGEGEELDLGEGEGDADGGEQEPVEQTQQQPSRYQRRITRQQQRIRELEETNRRFQDAMLRGTQQQIQPPPQTDPARQAQLDREEVERVSQLPFEEQSRYWARKTEERVQNQILRGNLETRDMLDRMHFSQIMRERRLPSRYETEVEGFLSQARQRGMNPTREELLYLMIGREVMTKKDRETDRQRQRGQRRIASQTTRPGVTARSTAATERGRRNQNQDAEDEALLRGITVGDFLKGNA